jgi:Fe-Mn family superoxide dismutase
MGKALGGGSGWVLLMWSPRAGKLVNQWAADHTMAIADGRGLITLDMYEHAYHMDFGAKVAAYVDAYMGALDWANADREFARTGAS